MEESMLVRMRTHIGGYRNGVEWPQVGNTIDVPTHEGCDLIQAGYAVFADGTTETVASPTEDFAGQADHIDDDAPAWELDGPDEKETPDEDAPAHSDEDALDDAGGSPSTADHPTVPTRPAAKPAKRPARRG